MEAPAYVTNMEGKSALPRKNGELVFREPWEGKIFAMAVAMNQGGMYIWDDFRDKLVAEITAAEKADPGHETEKRYYEHWQHAFEQLLIERNILDKGQVMELFDDLKECHKEH